MSQQFSLGRSQCAAISDPLLQQEINRHTDNADATDRIIRSIDRFGSDPSIVRFDVIPLPHGRGTRFASVAWTVRAVRLERPPGDREADYRGL
jgi:hypothetical protein